MVKILVIGRGKNFAQALAEGRNIRQKGQGFLAEVSI